MSDLPDTATNPSVAEWLTQLQSEADEGRPGKAGSRFIQLLSWEPHFASYASGGEVAARMGLHPSSVTRAAQSLGFTGWPSLRQALRDVYIVSPGVGSPSPAVEDADGAPFVLDHIRQLRSPESMAAIEAISGAIAQSRRTLIIGSGLAAAPGTVLSHLGALFGLDVRLAMDSPTAQIALMSMLTADDCVVGVNIWRMTRALHESLRAARERGARVCVITDAPGSRLSEIVDHLLYVPSRTDLPLPSVTAMTLAAEMIIKRAVDEERIAHARGVERLWERGELMDLHD